jgi:hypothetical protein
MAHVSGKSFTQVKKQVDDCIAQLELMQARLEDPAPALNAIVAEFSLMEAERFMDGGWAPEFGIAKFWSLPSDATLTRRASEGANTKEESLLAFGYLAKAAISPRLESFGTKGVKIIVDPDDTGAPEEYSHGRNYGVYQQNDPGHQFVTITPEFLEISKLIMEAYILIGKKEKVDRKGVDIPSNTHLRNTVRHAMAEKSRDFKKRDSLFASFGSVITNKFLGGGRTLGKPIKD